jgi:hypothetical protein
MGALCQPRGGLCCTKITAPQRSPVPSTVAIDAKSICCWLPKYLNTPILACTGAKYILPEVVHNSYNTCARETLFRVRTVESTASDDHHIKSADPSSRARVQTIPNRHHNKTINTINTINTRRRTHHRGSGRRGQQPTPCTWRPQRENPEREKSTPHATVAVWGDHTPQPANAPPVFFVPKPIWRGLGPGGRALLACPPVAPGRWMGPVGPWLCHECSHSTQHGHPMSKNTHTRQRRACAADA